MSGVYSPITTVHSPPAQDAEANNEEMVPSSAYKQFLDSGAKNAFKDDDDLMADFQNFKRLLLNMGMPLDSDEQGKFIS